MDAGPFRVAGIKATTLSPSRLPEYGCFLRSKVGGANKVFVHQLVVRLELTLEWVCVGGE